MSLLRCILIIILSPLPYIQVTFKLVSVPK
jgi:hypothetical protein